MAGAVARWWRRLMVAGVLVGFVGSTPVVVAQDQAPVAFTDFKLRTGLMRSHAVFASRQSGRVAYLGGSVTTREWRLGVQEHLAQLFPDTKFDFVMAGLGGTPAMLGAFRLEADVFKNGKVDLLFLEFAVNGGNVREMEGIVRQAKRLNPEIDIVMMYFANTDHVATATAGKMPEMVVEHERVAEHYGIPALFLSREVARRIQAGGLRWEEFSDDNVHPLARGCQLYASCINDFLDVAWREPRAAVVSAVPLPAPLDAQCYERAHYLAFTAASAVKGFAPVAQWVPTQPTCNFSPPAAVFAATTPGAELTLNFDGTAVGFLGIVGEDAGMIETTLDGAPPVKLDLYNQTYGKLFQLPNFFMFGTELKPGRHVLVLRVLAERNPASQGNAVRILQFMVN